MKGKDQPVRNITPNFIRFRKSPLPKPLERQRSDRSSSKASKSSLHEFENIVLHNSKRKLPVDCCIKSQKILNLVRNNRLIRMQGEKKSRSGSHITDKTKPDLKATNSFRQREFSRRRKQSSSSGSLHKFKRQEEAKVERQASPQKEQARAIYEKDKVMRNLIKGQRAPMPFMNKLKIRREDLKRSNRPLISSNQNFFNDPNIKLNPIKNLNNYEIYGELGKGAYGVVRMAYDKMHDQKVALKIYEKFNLDDPSKLTNVEREISIQAKLCHPTIAKIIEAIESPQEILIVQQYGGANSLYRYLLSKPQHRLEQDQAKLFFKLIVEAVAYLHELGIVHRDIKAQNILINRQHRLKLIDFGFSLPSSPPSLIDTFCGTPTYMAPEIVSKTDHVAMYTDIWSLGILFYVLVQGNYPFRAKCQEQLFDSIRKGNFTFIHEDTSETTREMISRFLIVDPLKRPKLSELLQSPQWTEWHC